MASGLFVFKTIYNPIATTLQMFEMFPICRSFGDVSNFFLEVEMLETIIDAIQIAVES